MTTGGGSGDGSRANHDDYDDDHGYLVGPQEAAGFGPPRTFKQRRRLLSATQRQAMGEMARLGVAPDGPVDPAVLFGQPVGGPAHPVVLDIGFGVGHSTLALALDRPAERVIAVEVHRPGVAQLLGALAGHDLDSVRVACADAVSFTTRLPDGSLDEVRAICPDPWPKARHHKRRLVRGDVLDEWARVLRPGGRVWIATDRAEYAEWSVEQFAAHPAFDTAPPDAHRDAAQDRPDTVYSTRGREAGRTMHDVVALRLPSSRP